MNTVILAAGSGSRLKPLNLDHPKSMLKIRNNMLIDYNILALLRNNITSISIVVGYQKEKLIKHVKEKFPEIEFKFIENSEYESKENIYSLYLAKPYIQGDDILIINSDLIYDEKLLKKALDTDFNTMIVDVNVKYTAESTKVKIDKSGHITDIGKDLSINESAGEYIGIMKILKNSAGLFLDQVAKMVLSGNDHVWYPYALKKILGKISLKPVFTGNMLWEEIDTIEDYGSAIQKAKIIIS